MTEHEDARAELRDALQAGPPEPAAAPGERLAAVQRRRRAGRRRVVAASGLAAAAVVAGAVVGFGLVGERGEDAGAAVGVDPAGTVGATGPELTCPPDGVLADAPDPRDAEAGGDPELPSDPVTVRLCPGPLQMVPQQPGAPDDEVAGDAALGAQMVETVNSTPPQDPAVTMCTRDGGPDYLLLLGYADGSVVPAAVESFGCRWVWVGGTPRPAADAVLNLLDVHSYS